MRFRKSGLAVLSALLIAFSVGCSTGTDQTNQPGTKENTNTGSKEVNKEENPPKEKVTIEVWTNTRNDKDVREAMIKKYNETNTDNIEIAYKIFTDNYNDQLKLALNAGKLPDLAYNFPSSMTDANYSLDLTSLITPDIRKRFDPAAFFVAPWAKNGEMTSVLENTTNFKLVYNKDLFKASGLDPEKPPTTWQEMRDYAKIITEKGGGKKYGLGLPLKQTVFWNYYVILPAARSGESFGRSGWNAVTGKYDFTIFSKYLKWWVDVNKDGSIFPGIGTYDNDMIRAQFSEGNVGMLSAATWDIGVYNDQFPAKIDWGVADFPTWDGKVLGGNPYETGNGYSINKNSKHLEEAEKVWQFLLSDEMFVELAKKGLGSYTNIAAQDKSIQPTDRKGVTGFLITPPATDYPREPKLDFSVMNPPPKVGNLDVDKGSVLFDVMNQAFLSGKDIDKQMKDITDVYNGIVDANVKAGKVDLSKYLKPDFKPLQN
jgi:multiple sugar transport system substrate-binding protein